ncbi:P-loop containing nucleoside triphosphate hydrolase protein [Pelagophyceae sp. CCMP2097]|nr:P-loop containing nucleoside triphosphate hydrolase protein [Pelagophyceae sp. CCMP2097]
MYEPLVDFADDDFGCAVLLEAQRLSYFVDVAELEQSGARPCRRRPMALASLLVDANVGVSRGELVGVLGPSGAGKSTLLKLLAQRVVGGYVAGRVALDGARYGRGDAFWCASIAYVEQDDGHHAPNLTCQETLHFACALRRPHATAAKRAAIVSRVARSLELDSVLASRVGGALERGVSGGQLKRLSIACETVGAASHFVLDEPSSGLDSRGALSLLTVLRSLADSQRGVVASLHTPPPQAWLLLDRVVLLAPGGVTLYCGGPADLERHVLALGAEPRAAGESVADFALCACHAQLEAVPGDALRGARGARRAAPPAPRKRPVKGDLARVTGRCCFALRFRIGVQASRFALRLSRDPQYSRAVVVRAAVMGVVAWLLFGRAGDLVGAALVQRIGAKALPSGRATDAIACLFFFNAYVAMNSFEGIPELFSRRRAYEIERAAGATTPLAEAVVAATSRLPLLAVSLLIFTSIAMPLLGFLRAPNMRPLGDSKACRFFDTRGGCPGKVEAWRVFAQSLWLVAGCQWIFYWASLALACSAPTAAVALSAFPGAVSLALCLAGFTVAVPQLLAPLKWISCASPVRWAFEGLLAVHLRTYVGGGDVLTYYGISTDSTDPLLRSLGALGMVGCAVLALVYAALARRPAAPFEFEEAPATQKHRAISLAAEAALLRHRSVARPPVLAPRRRGSDGDSIELGLLGTGESSPSDATARRPRPRRRSGSLRARRLGVKLGFSDVSYTVTKRDSWRGPPQTLRLLRGVSGCAVPGECVALLGASGAGKTTLLDLLACRKTTGVVEGAVLYNGAPTCPGVRRQTAYVPQDVGHVRALGCFTASEAISFAVRLRGAATTVDDLLDFANLGGSGGPSAVKAQTLDSLSGGQLRRVALAMELAHLPSLVFADEPTTGLDASAALEIMQSLRSLADSSRAGGEALGSDARSVVATVHQPSPAAFAAFDSCLVLAQGRVVYFGPADDGVRLFFVGLGFVPRPREGCDLADYAVTVAAGCVDCEEPRLREKSEALAMAFVASPAWKAADAAIAHAMTAPTTDADAAEAAAATARLQPFALGATAQAALLLERSLRRLARQKSFIRAAIIRAIVISVAYGALFRHVEADAASVAYNALSLHFFVLLFVVMTNVQSVALIFDDRLVFERERAATVYASAPYWLSATVAYGAFAFVNAFCIAAAIGAASGLGTRSPSRFAFILRYASINALGGVAGYAHAALAAASSRTPQQASVLFSFTAFVSLALSGFLVKLPQLSAPLRWASKASYARWAFQALLLHELQEPRGSQLMGSDAAAARLLGDTYDFSDRGLAETLAYLGAAIAGLLALHFLLLRRLRWERR